MAADALTHDEFIVLANLSSDVRRCQGVTDDHTSQLLPSEGSCIFYSHTRRSVHLKVWVF